MAGGLWLVLEDVDRGSADLQVLLTPLLRSSQSLSSPVLNTTLLDPVTGTPVCRHPDFRILMTRRLVKSHSGDLRLEYDNVYADMIERQSCLIMLPAMHDDSLRLLIPNLFPGMQTLVDRVIMNIYHHVCYETAATSIEVAPRSRAISPRDLLKFCARIASLSEETRQSDVLLLHAVDCFLACLSDSSRLRRLATLIAGELNLTPEKVTHILYRRRIELNVNPDEGAVHLGRACLPCRRTAEWETRLAGGVTLNGSPDGISWPFASTHLACTLLERLAVGMSNHEPLLLVGETGTGKTSAVQRLAQLCGRRLHVVNLNQQSDSIDLLGGFKPVDMRTLIRPLREKFETLFCRTFRMETNATFLGHINTCFNDGRWRELFTLMQHPSRLALTRPETSARPDWLTFLQQLDRLQRRLEAVAKPNQPSLGFAFIEGVLVRALQDGDWVLLDEINLAPAEMFDSLSGLLDSERGSLTLVERGDKEPLKRSSDFHLFAAMNPSTDVGKRELPVGLRNRFTEIYVPELDPGLDDTDLDPVRAVDREDLATLIRSYLRALNPSPVQITSLVRLYAALRTAALEGLVDGVGQRPHFSLRTLCRALIEAGRGYHGSTVRSLYEGLIFSFGSQISRSSRPVLDLLIRRYLCLSFGSQNRKLDLDTLNQLIASPLPKPIEKRDASVKNQADYQHVEGYWIPRGPREPRQPAPDTLVDGNYILTPSVRANLKDLARVVAAGGSLPVLLQGETSVGKTSLITYLASRIGQICYRINNHEHTDQQTYLGTYTVASATAQATGKLAEENGTSTPPLVFKDGPLVQAMRLGHWIILDELNLAPTDILEALNRVLDDNRTVFIPDTQEVVRAHSHFRLFATQNPPGLYAGRKMLSRALRNRFIELHFDPIPRDELEIILEKRCALPRSRAHRLVEVMHRLQLARCNSNLFQGKDSFITLRDLFRWAERYRLATCATPATSEKPCTFFDWDTYLAEQGYLLLAGRVRNSSEAKMVAEAIEAVFKRPVSESRLFDFTSETSPACLEFLEPFLSTQNPESGRPTGFEHIVWTRDMRRMLVLIGNALKYREPVLLIGDTSCGKTTVCQLFAAIKHQNLHCVNCHQYTEAADFLGGLRPVRRSQSEGDSEPAQDGRLFEWVDGPLVTAMMRGEMFLLDEISLADDAVLECLNSLLEPERRLHLSERFEDAANGVLTPVESNELTAHVDFRLVATMNPGGDYGKKELSPALRNRFTEIWCPSPVIPAAGNCTEPSSLSQCQLSSDLFDIVEHNLLLYLPFLREPYSLMTKQLACAMVDFVVRIADMQLQCGGLVGRRAPPTIRDLIAWIRFMQSVTIDATGLQPPASLSTSAISCRPNRSASLDVLSACLHGAALVFLDALDQNTSSIANQGIGDLVADANVHLWKRLRTIAFEHHLPTNALDVALHYADNSSDLVTEGEAVCEQFGLVDGGLWFGADPFYLRTGPRLSTNHESIAQPFSFSAPTPAMNLRRLLRAMQLPQRALLLEGSPGVGKTTLVLALARACGHDVVRINLSEATEASDLIGCDLPVEGAGAGVFVWRDGPLLQGLRRGHWIVLDEMNLASQSVLECLNACLDHRGEIYIPELGTSFKVNPESTHLFACQNPVREGGGRKGLPKSFLNRFTQVYLQPLSTADQSFILHQLYPALTPTAIRLMLRFNETLNQRVNVKHEFATEGGPWEFNLRDLMRWSEMILKGQSTEGISPGLYVHFIYVDRMRSIEDKQKVADLWQEVCSESQITELMVYYKPLGYMRLIGKKQLRVGLAGFDHISNLDANKLPNYLILDQHRGVAESLLKILEMGWMAILVGPPGSGKRTLVNICSTLVGQPIATMSLSPTADTVELLGTLEQREAGGLFSWVDSPLVTGMRNGHWVVIENAHFCSPSVLDRLNSVLESGGELVLGERGLDSEGRLIRLRPHTAFRLILIVDETVYGASHSVPNGVSRAMRNRGVEIATLSEVTSAELDFTRLLVSRGTPLPFVHALITFHSIYANICAGLSSGITHQSNLLSESMFTALRPGCCKRPPVGMLLSAGLMVNQLLDTSPDTGLFIPTMRPLFHDDNDVNDEQADSINYDPNCSQTHWCWILHHTLNLVYTMRQPNHQAARLTNQLVRRFIRDIWENRPEMRQSLEQLDYANPTAFVLHHLSELVQCGTADGYRRHHARLVCMAARSCPADQSLHRRIFLEQATLDDLSHLPDQLTQAIQPIDKTVVDSLGLPSTWVSEDWTDWPDLRWFPGWRYLTIDSSRLSVHKWDIHFRSLLIDELVQFVTSSCVPSSEVPEKLNQVEQLSVVQAVCQLRHGHLSAAWLDNFPGLKTVLDPWLDFVRSFMFVKAEESRQADWLTCCRAISLMWTWFSHFALKPLFVEAIDWSDRLTYYTERAQMCGLEERPVHPPCFEIMRPHFSLSIQPRFFSCSIESPLIVPNWILFGKKLGDILVTLRADCSSNDLDEDEDVQDEEKTELLYTNTQLSDEVAPATDFSTKTPQVRSMCLWPLAMLSMLRFDRCVVSRDPAAGSIRARVRIFLLGLTRPRILTVLSMLQPSFMPLRAQQRAFQRCLTETAVDRWVQDVCCQIDLLATGRLASAFTVDQLERPTLSGEWRSLSQATFALTWPTLSRYSEGTCSTDQPLIGWLHSRIVFGYAHRLLLLCSTWTPKNEITSSPSSNQRQHPADVRDLLQQSATLLHTVHSVLVSFLHPEHIQPNTSDQPFHVNDFMQWILSSFTPTVEQAKLAFCGSREWMELLHLIEGFIACLIQLSHQPTSPSLLALGWIIFGCVHVRSVCPHGPLDPWLVEQLELEASSSELQRVDRELVLRQKIRNLTFGHPEGALPISTTSEPAEWMNTALNLRNLANAGLEHPWVAALMTYREQLASKVSDLSERAAKNRSLVPMKRQISNLQYSQLRRRLSAFVTGFTDKLLLAPRKSDERYPMITPSICTTRWLEVVSDLCEWLTEPERLNTFADIVEPFLNGILSILQGLRIWAHNVSSVRECQSSAVLELVELLSTGLLTNKRITERKISTSCPSSALSLATQLTSVAWRNILKQSVSRDLLSDSSQANRNAQFRMEFRLFSLVLDLIWLHRLESCELYAYSNNTQFIGRLLAFLNRPLAWRWQQAEAERKKLAAERAALFIEATGRKRQLQHELQQLPKRSKQRLADENSDLVDPDLIEEVEWRLRFPETASLQAVIELTTDRRSFGLAKEEQIQQTVDRMQAVDAWLAEALRKTDQTWVPDDCELSYWVERTLGLLLADVNCTDLGQSTIEWRWHVLLGGYSLAGWLACHHDSLSLDPAIDVSSLPVHIVTTAYLSQADLRARIRLHDRTRPFRHVLDVYRDPIPLDAALQLQTVMERLDSRVRQLLHDWPGQPSLIRLLTLRRRLEGFRVSDPLIKFLTGLEMVWQEILEWEKNAGKHVSLMEHCKAVCDLLIEWRKMELKCWLSTLDTAERTLANCALTLWFHLHDVFLTRPSASSQSPPDVNHCEVLVQLMENGPLAEFTTRWRLLAGLRVALDIWPGLDEQTRSNARRIVGNVIWFYAQFVPHVQQELVNLRRPIEKELKGIVHVTKWGDYAHFWSVKCNVDRCKKNIHKQVRNWEAALRRPVRPLFEAAIAIPRLESLSSLAALDVRLPSTTLISTSENRWPFVDDLQWLCAEEAQRHSLPNLLRRLPTLLTRFRRHLERLQTEAPVAKWTQCLLTGMRTWIQLVSELENSTRHLESTCPPAHRLRQLRATETKSATRNPEPNDLDEVRKWHQQFTALQQQKRLVLAQWLKVASARSQPCGYALREGNQFEASPELDESRLSTFEESLAEVEEEKDEDSAEMISFDGGTLPQLGLSYRRGQRHTQTGFMTEFLVHIQGDPWMQVNSHVLQTVQEGPGSTAKSSAEKESDHNARHLVVTTCQRLARLIALRAGLPRTPGPPDATPETVSAIIGELGGPANLARLVGLADDLLNQCTTAMGVCSRVDSMARDFSQRTDACRASLYGIVANTNSVGKLERDDIQAHACIPFGSDKTVLHRIKASVHTVDQLVQDTVHLSSTFWKACSQHSLAYPSKQLTDLREVFGSEIWDSMIQTHLPTSVNAFDPLCIRMEQYSTQLDTVAVDIRNSASSMLSSQTFLFTPCWVQWHSQFNTSVNTLLAVINEMMAECARSGFRFTALDQQLSCVSSRMRAELELLSCNLASARQTYTVELTPISFYGGDTQYEVLANNLIKSVLSTMETLYHADRQINVTEKDMNEKSQVELLNHYAQATYRACELILKRVSKYLSRLCSQLEQSDPSIFPVRLRLLRSLFPLIDALMQSVQLRSAQFWQLLDSWARLAECILRITGRLLTDGFCRPAGLDRSATGTDGCTPTDNQIGQTQGADGGGTSLTAEGVDTTGAKDVSNELECQEQIEGLMDDSRQDSEQTNQDEKRRDGESEGIEMPDDNFQGEFEDPDLMQDEKVDESLDEAPGDELDDRMGGTGGQSDGLSKEMWASEDEDDRMDHTEDGKSSATQEKETGGVEEKDADKNNCSTGDGSELQNQDKSKETDETENKTKKNVDEFPSESQEPSSDKRSRPKKSSQDTMTVAGDEGQADPPDDDLVSECKPDGDADDSPEKDDAILAELEAQRLEKENSDEPEDMPSDLPDQSMDDKNDNDDITDIRGESASEDDVHADGPSSDNQLDEPMENEREGKDTVDNFHYQPAAGDLTTKSEVPDELDCSRPQSDAWESSDRTNNTPMDASKQQAGYQRTSSSQYGDEGVTPYQFKKPEDTGVNTETQPKRRAQCGPRPTSDNRSQDSSTDKPLRGVEVMDTDENTNPQEATDQDSSGTTDHDLYQHITPEDTGKDGDKKSPELRVVDSANERQQEYQGQPLSPKPPDTDVGRESEDANGEVDAISIDVTDPTQPLNPLPPQKSYADPSSKGNAGSDSATLPDAELDLITTLGAQRPPDSFICTRSEAVQQIASPRSVEQLLMDTSMPDNQSAITPVSPDKAREALSEWLSCTQRSIDLARQLCESLRLVLEPTKAARMRGDYRTGKRINMRKIIPYLASQFRKDKIWLRRSQPSQREYRILIAVDDSSSMSDNLCRQMTFDALATVVTALNLLEVGRIGICSFGESVRVLHHLEDTWVPNAGPNVLARFTFQQSRTSLVQLLHSAIKMVMHACSGSTSTGTVPSQLLLILSDGVFSEDPQEPSVQAAVRLARDARLFPVCVILDDVRKKHSIFDLRRYTSAGKLTPYMDTFPLPFYVVLRDVTALPNLLSDALRQWFELEASFGC
ncbi:hypothetical protein P879_04155 [Paragonimus westermani]|uniref:Midasin n=1 Tax=Paragonimus westermani TaxID=34504 RepID=A0A8T0D2M4_9TREM|nr:hypothetical protein P879_04155 [Paragonimus westermani]